MSHSLMATTRFLN